jgi:hypothetical protein
MSTKDKDQAHKKKTKSKHERQRITQNKHEKTKQQTTCAADRRNTLHQRDKEKVGIGQLAKGLEEKKQNQQITKKMEKKRKKK